MAEAVDGSAWGFNQLEFNELLASVCGFEKEDFDDREDFALSKQKVWSDLDRLYLRKLSTRLFVSVCQRRREKLRLGL